MLEDAPRAVKIILFAVLVVFALAVIVTTRNIFVANAPDVWENCAGGSWVQIHQHEAKLTRESATDEIKTHADGDVIFDGNSIEPCGIGYVFHDSSGEKYLVCEDGSISKYVKNCKGGGLLSRGETSLETMKNSTLSRPG